MTSKVDLDADDFQIVRSKRSTKKAKSKKPVTGQSKTVASLVVDGALTDSGVTVYRDEAPSTSKQAALHMLKKTRQAVEGTEPIRLEFKTPRLEAIKASCSNSKNTILTSEAGVPSSTEKKVSRKLICTSPGPVCSCIHQSDSYPRRYADVLRLAVSKSATLLAQCATASVRSYRVAAPVKNARAKLNHAAAPVVTLNASIKSAIVPGKSATPPKQKSTALVRAEASRIESAGASIKATKADHYKEAFPALKKPAALGNTLDVDVPRMKIVEEHRPWVPPQRNLDGPKDNERAIAVGNTSYVDVPRMKTVEELRPWVSPQRNLDRPKDNEILKSLNSCDEKVEPHRLENCASDPDDVINTSLPIDELTTPPPVKSSSSSGTGSPTWKGKALEPSEWLEAIVKSIAEPLKIQVDEFNYMRPDTFPPLLCQFEDEHYLHAERCALLALKISNNGQYPWASNNSP